MNKSYSEELAGLVTALIEKHKFHYSFEEEEGLFRLCFDTDSGFGSINTVIELGTDKIVLYAFPDIKVKKAKALQVAELLMRINYDHVFGAFQMNLDDGHIEYRITMDLEETAFSEAVLDNCFTFALGAFDDYGDTILEIMFGGITAKEAYEKLVEAEPNEGKDENFSESATFPDMNVNREMTFQNLKTTPSKASVCDVVETAIVNMNNNPIFISGPDGSGKAHMLNAAGIFYTEKHPDAKVVLLTAETFHKYIVEEQSDEFRNVLKTCDLLLLDDFNESHAGTFSFVEALFQILCVRLENKKLTIIASPQPVQEYHLPERLEVRLKRGLCLQMNC